MLESINNHHYKFKLTDHPAGTSELKKDEKGFAAYLDLHVYPWP